MGWKFWTGVVLCVGGIVLMSIPETACVDCEDEVLDNLAESPIYKVNEISDEVAGD
jgi:hypothetical protein